MDIRGRRGSALATALVVLVLAALLGGALLRTSVFGKQMAAKEAAGAQAYYVAESAMWRVISNPSLYEDDLFGPAGRAEVFGDFDDSGKEYRVTIEPIVGKGPDIYLVAAYGSTPYSQRLAAAEVRLRQLTDVTGMSAFHFGAMSLGEGQSSVPSMETTTGNQYLIAHHFRGSDVNIYGTLTLDLGQIKVQGTEYDRHNRESFNIWGESFENDQFQFLTQYPYDEGDPLDAYDWNYPDGDLTDVTWLLGKHGRLEDGMVMPDIADHVRRSLEVEMGGAYVTQLAPGSSNSLLLVGEGDILAAYNALKSNKEPDPAATYSNAWMEYDATPSNRVDVAGLGFLKLYPQSGEIIVDDLYLLDDLFIITDVDIHIARIHARGHRLVIITDRSIYIGGSSNEWSPFPPQATVTDYYLGPQSVLWAATNLIIKGSVRPDTPTARADSNSTPIIVWNDTSETINDDSVSEWPSIGLLARDGALRFHLLKGSGLLYTGGTIECYRLRLHGLAFVNDPYRKGNEGWIGITECHLSTSDDVHSFITLIGVPDVITEVLSIVR